MAKNIDPGIHAEPAALLREPVTRFLERHATREAVATLEGSEVGFSAAHWKDLAEIGCLGLLLPERFGGSQGAVRAMATVVELLATRALQTPLFATAIDAVILISRLGTPAQQAEMLPGIASGAQITVAAVHESAASPPKSVDEVRTTAERSPSGWRLRGTKLYVPYFNSADQVLCVARVADSKIGVFVVPAESNGLKATRLRTSNGDPMFALELDGVILPPASVLGTPGESWPVVAAMLDVGAALKSTELLGFGRQALKLTQEFVQVRVQFGQPIGALQVVQHHVADMYRLVEQTRVLVEQVVAFLDDGRPAVREVSLAKIKAGEGIGAVLNMAHQLHGGVGYYTDYPLERYYRRTMAAQGAYGSSRWHRHRLSDLLRDEPDQFRRTMAHPLQFDGSQR